MHLTYAYAHKVKTELNTNASPFAYSFINHSQNVKLIFLVKAYYDLCTLKNKDVQNVALIIYSPQITSGSLRTRR